MGVGAAEGVACVGLAGAPCQKNLVCLPAAQKWKFMGCVLLKVPLKSNLPRYSADGLVGACRVLVNFIREMLEHSTFRVSGRKGAVS